MRVIGFCLIFTGCAGIAWIAWSWWSVYSFMSVGGHHPQVSLNSSVVEHTPLIVSAACIAVGVWLLRRRRA